MKEKKVFLALCACACLLAVPALAVSPSGDVSSAIESTWKAAAAQVQTVVNNVVFPAVSLVLAVLFFVKLAMCYMDYKKHGNFEFTGPALLFAGLILALTAPLYLWTILGI